MEYIWSQHRTKKYIWINTGLFLFFLLIYTILDVNANETYPIFVSEFGVGVVVLHILLNVLISFGSSIVLTWSFITLKLNKRDIKGSNLPYLGVVIGFLTFGCTPCVVAFLSIFGIAFAPIILPAGNLLWKIVVLGIVMLSIFITAKNAGKACNIKY